MHAVLAVVAVGPDDFFLGGDFEEFYFAGFALAVAADDGVAVGQALSAAGVGPVSVT